MKKKFLMLLSFVCCLRIFAQTNVVPPEGYVVLPSTDIITQSIQSNKKAYIADYCQITVQNTSFYYKIKLIRYLNNKWTEIPQKLITLSKGYRDDGNNFCNIQLEKNAIYAVDFYNMLGRDYPDVNELAIMKQSFEKDFQLISRTDGILLLTNKPSFYTTLLSIKQQRDAIKILNSSPYKNELYAYDLLPGSGDIVINAYLGDSVEELAIPNTIEDIPVGSIRNFKLKEGLIIKKLSIPSSVKTIEDSVFSNLGIEELIFEKDSEIQKIGSNAFRYNNISELNLPKNKISIGLDAFSNNKFKKISIYKDYSFFYKTKGGKFWFEDCVKQEENGILNSETIEEVIFEEGCVSIPPRAFCNCDNLKTVYIPSTMKQYGALAFAGCDNLSELIIAGIPLSEVKNYDELAERARAEAKRSGTPGAEIMGEFSADVVSSMQLRTDPYSCAWTFLGCPLSIKTTQILMKMGLPEWSVKE